ncbi:MAG: 30S ribosomal protein S6 [Spirochaetales bacterium]|jgi:small subunit ribosomal protein S6|uniref:Small ribosomal subunit protein bS6 n=1 Tax=Treponema berlinense TaxID=225004 RepID=A0A1T4KVT7_9SPIR|nr:MULTISPECIES: 30S ribosomal protein S6 [Treponema]MDO5766828.1 30S ribosomal protein S6 [Spirochaetales bacterium]MBQ9102397.1 30S ribosomal protein S6 [Treponema sp.]MDD5835511.1 30S ribosomal protein S6 [Treponema berlinense]MDY3707023.1 30S ribosomal protein S6 [Treponema berlinense]SJZ46468.1 small subunit ribosomal protein S6 [Treponema berlinense]
MRKYELMTVFSTEEDKFKAASDAVRSVLANFGAKIDKEESYGDRDLTYVIEKQKRGRFVLFTVSANPAKITEIESQFKLTQNLLKWLFVKIED